MCREFGGKGLIYISESEPPARLGDQIRENSLYFPGYQGMPAGDEFAEDRFHRQLVSCFYRENYISGIVAGYPGLRPSKARLSVRRGRISEKDDPLRVPRSPFGNLAVRLETMVGKGFLAGGSSLPTPASGSRDCIVLQAECAREASGREQDASARHGERPTMNNYR